MTAVIAYIALVIGGAALLCAHQNEGPPPGARRIARVLCQPRPAWVRGPITARTYARRTRQEPT